MRISGTFKGRLVNTETGEIICWEKHNKMVKGGFDWIANVMSNQTNRASAMSHIAFGTGGDTTTYTMTSLQNEVARYPSTVTWNSETRELAFTGRIPQNAGVNASITEVGIFNANTGGVMLDRATFLPKGVEDSTYLEYTFVISISE